MNTRFTESISVFEFDPKHFNYTNISLTVPSLSTIVVSAQVRVLLIIKSECKIRGRSRLLIFREFWLKVNFNGAIPFRRTIPQAVND